eukprot:5858394-Pyramimonas_sp.AAC.1
MERVRLPAPEPARPGEVLRHVVHPSRPADPQGAAAEFFPGEPGGQPRDGQEVLHLGPANRST